MRNRGYRFIIRDLGFMQGCCALCINSTWINQLLEETGVDPRDFRKLTWEDLYIVQDSEEGRAVIEELRPRNFWQMCDAVSFLHTVYDTDVPVYRKKWFRRYPVLVMEDVYELLIEEGFADKEAMEVAEFVEEACGEGDRRELRDFLELYDVPPQMCQLLLSCEKLPRREEMIRETLELISKASALVEKRQVRSESSL
ncbi:MAG: hypothetical protein IKI75_06860 [Lachnospiraceae bacterium]|nr:hypothetical protein [Lachnospiraceae bacterium]